MTRSKLSASDREELIRLFKETTETITSLAEHFQVSVSTARRVLKTQLSAEEYETIVTNRLEGRQSQRNAPTSTKPEVEATPETSAAMTEADSVGKNKLAPPVRRPKRRSRRRSSAEDKSVTNSEDTSSELSNTPKTLEDSSESDAPVGALDSVPARPAKKQAEKIAPPVPRSAGTPLEVHPIDVASFPNQCYLVVDRASELITPPLKEFAELGDIPSSEESAKTLPIFENHKIASRFSRRSQRIIKIPNSDILKKTYSLLNAKGVERILFDGQVFSLSNSQSYGK